jgi:hypothetical protein
LQGRVPALDQALSRATYYDISYRPSQAKGAQYQNCLFLHEESFFFALGVLACKHLSHAWGSFLVCAAELIQVGNIDVLVCKNIVTDQFGNQPLYPKGYVFTVEISLQISIMSL